MTLERKIGDFIAATIAITACYFVFWVQSEGNHWISLGLTAIVTVWSYIKRREWLDGPETSEHSNELPR